MKSLILKSSFTFILAIFCICAVNAQTNQISTSKKVANYTPVKVETIHVSPDSRLQKVKAKTIAKKFPPVTDPTQFEAKVKAPKALNLRKKD